MHIHDFFLELRQAALALPVEKLDRTKPPAMTERELLINRIDVLIQQASNPPDKRHQRMMLEAWLMTVGIGKRYDLFARYRGNEGLRAQLRLFLL